MIKPMDLTWRLLKAQQTLHGFSRRSVKDLTSPSHSNIWISPKSKHIKEELPNEEYSRLSDEMLARLGQLNAKGEFTITSAKGKGEWGPEPSFMLTDVPNHLHDDVHRLADEYEQDSVAVSGAGDKGAQFVKPDGKVTDEFGGMEFQENPEFSTDYPSGQRLAFTDWSDPVQTGEPMDLTWRLLKLDYPDAERDAVLGDSAVPFPKQADEGLGLPEGGWEDEVASRTHDSESKKTITCFNRIHWQGDNTEEELAALHDDVARRKEAGDYTRHHESALFQTRHPNAKVCGATVPIMNSWENPCPNPECGAWYNGNGAKLKSDLGTDITTGEPMDIAMRLLKMPLMPKTVKEVSPGSYEAQFYNPKTDVTHPMRARRSGDDMNVGIYPPDSSPSKNMLDDEASAFASFREKQGDPDKLRPFGVYVEEPNRRQGMGTAMYDMGSMITPQSIVPSDQQSAGGAGLWTNQDPSGWSPTVQTGEPMDIAWRLLKAKKEKPFHGYNPKKHSKKGGLNAKGRAAAKRKTGANLKPPVTTKPSKLKPGSKKAKRRKSFCARMTGVKGPTSKKGKLTPKGASLKRWNC